MDPNAYKTYGDYLRAKALEEKEKRMEKDFSRATKVLKQDSRLKTAGQTNVQATLAAEEQAKREKDMKKAWYEGRVAEEQAKREKDMWQGQTRLGAAYGTKAQKKTVEDAYQDLMDTSETARGRGFLDPDANAAADSARARWKAEKSRLEDMERESGEKDTAAPPLKIKGSLYGKTPEQLDKMRSEKSFDPYGDAAKDPQPSPEPQADREKFDAYNASGNAQDVKDIEKAMEMSKNRKTPGMLSKPAEDIAWQTLSKVKADPNLTAAIRKMLSDNGCDANDGTLYQLVVDAAYNKDFAEASGLSGMPFYGELQRIKNETTDRYIAPAAEEITKTLKSNSTVDFGGVLKKAGEQGYSPDEAGVTGLIKDKIQDPRNLEAFCSYAALDDTARGWVDYVLGRQDFKKGEDVLTENSRIKIDLEADIVNAYAYKHVPVTYKTVQEISSAVMELAKSKYLAEQSVEKALGIDSIRGRQAYGWGERVGGSLLYNLAEAGMGFIDFGLDEYEAGKDLISKPTEAIDAVMGTNGSALREGMDKAVKEKRAFWADQDDVTWRYMLARGGDAEAMGITGGLLRGATKTLMDTAMLYASGAGKEASKALQAAEAGGKGAKAAVDLKTLYDKGVKYINQFDDIIKNGGDFTGAVKKVMGEDIINYITEKASGRLMEKAGVPLLESQIQKALAKQGFGMAKDKVNYLARTLYDRMVRGEKSDYDRYVKEQMDKGATRKEAQDQADIKFYVNGLFGLD